MIWCLKSSTFSEKCFSLTLTWNPGTKPPLSGLVAELKMSVWMPDIVLKPVKTNMKASPRRNTFNFFTWKNEEKHIKEAKHIIQEKHNEEE